MTLFYSTFSVTSFNNVSLTYDFQNRIANAGGAIAVYDGDGMRVQKVVAGAQTNYIYGPHGQVIAEADGSGNWTKGYVYLAGEQIATYRNGQTYFVHKDHLGSTRILTDVTGMPVSGEVYDYLPFGTETKSGTLDSHRFTGKERDGETALDYFGARYYASSLGRFMTPDWNKNATAVPYAEFGDPQSLNLYTYVRNNPLNRVDADGHRITGIWGGGEAIAYPIPEFETNAFGEYFDSGFDMYYVTTIWGNAESQEQAQQQSQPQPGRQPDGSYIAPTGPGSEIAKITDPATPLPPLIGNGQCVTACKHFSGITAPTSQWQEGPGAANNPNLPIGTAIATFGSNGKYPTNGDQNSGIYMGQGKKGSILILDQWPAHAASGTPAHPPQIREMRFNDGSTLSNSAQAYHVIIVPAQ